MHDICANWHTVIMENRLGISFNRGLCHCMRCRVLQLIHTEVVCNRWPLFLKSQALKALRHSIFTTKIGIASGLSKLYDVLLKFAQYPGLIMRRLMTLNTDASFEKQYEAEVLILKMENSEIDPNL